MPYKMSWFKEGRITLVRIEGNIAVDEIRNSSMVIRDDYLDVGEIPVHIIADVTDLTGFPTHLMAVKQSVDMMLSHPSLGWLVLVGFKNPVARFLAGTISQAMKVRFQQASTIDEALIILSKMDATLANTNA